MPRTMEGCLAVTSETNGRKALKFALRYKNLLQIILRSLLINDDG